MNSNVNHIFPNNLKQSKHLNFQDEMAEEADKAEGQKEVRNMAILYRIKVNLFQTINNIFLQMRMKLLFHISQLREQKLR